MVDAPSGGALEQAPRWDLVDTESYGGGIRVLAPYLIVWGYVGIYRRKEYVGRALRGPRDRGALLGGHALHPHDLLGHNLVRLAREGAERSRRGTSRGAHDASHDDRG